MNNLATLAKLIAVSEKRSEAVSVFTIIRKFPFFDRDFFDAKSRGRKTDDRGPAPPKKVSGPQENAS
jgi:hypothetical protein